MSLMYLGAIAARPVSLAHTFGPHRGGGGPPYVKNMSCEFKEYICEHL